MVVGNLASNFAPVLKLNSPNEAEYGGHICRLMRNGNSLFFTTLDTSDIYPAGNQTALSQLFLGIEKPRPAGLHVRDVWNGITYVSIYRGFWTFDATLTADNEFSKPLTSFVLTGISARSAASERYAWPTTFDPIGLTRLPPGDTLGIQAFVVHFQQ